MPKRIDYTFVFGSNEAGIHGAGAAKYALQHKGAEWGKGFGPQGQCFAIPTKNALIESLELPAIRSYVNVFILCAMHHPEATFQVTAIGCGLAGFKHEDIAPLFKDAPSNCHFDELWRPYLGDEHTYWGTF